MRVTLTHLLPLALLLINPILAESDSTSSAVTKPAASHSSAAAAATSSGGGKKEASATDEASATASATATATADPSGTGKDSKASSSNKDDSSKPTATRARLDTATFDPTPPATLAPDLNGALAMHGSGFMGLGVAFGAVAVGINYL